MDPDDMTEQPWGRRAEDRVGMRVYVEMMLRDVDRRLDKIDQALDRMNEFSEKFLTKEWYEEHHEPLEERMRLVELWQSNIMGRAVAVGLLGAVLIATVAGLIVHLIPK